jgi:ribosomal-protein-alanine N-acetyltransferase
MPAAMAHACCMVARDVPTDRIVGFALARREQPCEGHIMALAVDSMHRGEGIGRALLGGVRHEMLREGAMRLSLEVRADNQRAQAFYVRNGFHPEGLESHAYDDGMDAVRFARAI